LSYNLRAFVTKTMPRTHKAVVFACIALVALAACLPVVASHFSAVLTPLWLVVPAATITVVRRTAVRCDEQTVSLLSLILSRAPPATRALA
jgi:hypothetical protein